MVAHAEGFEKLSLRKFICPDALKWGVLPKINRGLQKKDFERILGEGKTIQTPLFGVKYTASERTKYGWIISKKISKRAVDRNKIKRRLAEVIGKKMINNMEIVILVKTNILNARLEEIEKCWQMTYEKIDT